MLDEVQRSRDDALERFRGDVEGKLRELRGVYAEFEAGIRVNENENEKDGKGDSGNDGSRGGGSVSGRKGQRRGILKMGREGLRQSWK